MCCENSSARDRSRGGASKSHQDRFWRGSVILLTMAAAVVSAVVVLAATGPWHFQDGRLLSTRSWCPRLETNLHGLTVPLPGLSCADARAYLVFELPRRLQVGGSERDFAR